MIEWLIFCMAKVSKNDFIKSCICAKRIKTANATFYNQLIISINICFCYCKYSSYLFDFYLSTYLFFGVE